MGNSQSKPVPSTIKAKIPQNNPNKLTLSKQIAVKQLLPSPFDLPQNFPRSTQPISTKWASMIFGSEIITSTTLNTDSQGVEKRHDNEQVAGLEELDDWVYITKSPIQERNLRSPHRIAKNGAAFVGRRRERRGVSSRKLVEGYRHVRKFKSQAQLEEEEQVFESLNPFTLKDDREYALKMGAKIDSRGHFSKIEQDRFLL